MLDNYIKSIYRNQYFASPILSTTLQIFGENSGNVYGFSL